ncbi:MAG: glycosyltransferase family 4 protein [Chloroflexi bacterium]|nr:glycosyltransferase family 4 protein [Chloroflexota bacterium]
MKIGYLLQEGGPDIRQRPLTGPANHVLKVFQELRGLGHEVILLARWQGRIWRSVDAEVFEPVTVATHDRGWRRWVERGVRGVQSRLRLPYANWFESLRFAAACRQELSGCDLLYERMGWMGYGGGLAARAMGVPLVLEINNGDFVTELKRLGVAPRGFQYRFAVWLMRGAARRADFAVATGDGHRQRFISFWKSPAEKIVTVENGSDVVTLLPRARLKAFRSGVSRDGDVTFVFIGAFEPWHGVLILLEAFAQALQSRAAMRLVIIGSGTLADEIKARIAQLGIQEQVTLTGQVDIQDAGAYLAEADIGLAPYCGWMEFSGLKIFDYKSAGLVSLVSGQDGQPATIVHGKTGWIVPPCDGQTLQEAMIYLADHPELRREIGQAARLEAERMHSWRCTAQQLENVFVQVIATMRAKG